MAEILIVCGWFLLFIMASQIAWLTLQVIAAQQNLVTPELPATRRGRLTVLIPAHNEADGIKKTLDSAKCQLLPGDSIVVVADNCDDETATIATQCGVDVVRRSDAAHRGKGYALAFGIDQLREDPPEMVIFLDADCVLAPRALDWLAYVCKRHNRPAQSAYLMHASATSTPVKKVAEFAWVVKNWLRPLGASRLGIGCPLYGSGMAFPWRLAASAPLATSHLVEDLKLGLDLALAGKVPVFCPEAVVTSTFPENSAGTAIQRTRWEHGHLGLILTYVPRLVFKAMRSGNPKLFMLAVDLSIPPLSLLILVAVLSAIGSGAVLFFTERLLPWLGFPTVAVLLFATIFLAWHKAGRKIIDARESRHAVRYIFAKIPLYLRFLIHRQTEWVRSDRDQP